VRASVPVSSRSATKRRCSRTSLQLVGHDRNCGKFGRTQQPTGYGCRLISNKRNSNSWPLAGRYRERCVKLANGKRGKRIGQSQRCSFDCAFANASFCALARAPILKARTLKLYNTMRGNSDKNSDRKCRNR